MIILGAGLAGCLAGALNRDAEIYEAGPDKTTHKAVLRFRSPDIGQAVGIPFKEVKVYKAIWYEDKQVPLSPRMINQYSDKVSGSLSERSITRLETETRWLAPDDLLDRLKTQCHKITYNVPINRNFIKDCQATNESIVSTVPLHVMAGMFNLQAGDMTNAVSPIYVNQYNIMNCDVYQTIYYPDPTLIVYRASISGDTLIVESTMPLMEAAGMNLYSVWRSFGLSDHNTQQTLTDHEQQNGKMLPIDEKIRRKAIIDLTLNHSIFSLGRFATWRNILMDDVYKDILHIKKLINKDAYYHYLEYMKNES